MRSLFPGSHRALQFLTQPFPLPWLPGRILLSHLCLEPRRSPLQLAITSTINLQWKDEASLQGVPWSQASRWWLCHSEMQRSLRQLAWASWVQQQAYKPPERPRLAAYPIMVLFGSVVCSQHSLWCCSVPVSPQCYEPETLFGRSTEEEPAFYM